MTKYIVRAITNGSKVDLQAPGHTAERALANVQGTRLARNADTYVVYERKTNGIVLAVQGPRRKF